ncbi:MAG TPA: glycosyl hydrolase family 17 protein [Anaeromyxobacteraceae bacterium]|nr:glycosyl hydrolase family 17 protein [Anaeromyxobacteraceae bacterium]
MDAPPPGTARLELTDLPLDALVREFRRTLEGRIHGICFSAYMDSQSPDAGTVLTEGQVRDRLAIVAPAVRWVRTFSCTDGNEHAPRIAHELGLSTLVGAWLGTDARKNEEEIRGLVELARAGHADVLAVGNEVLYREDLPEGELVEAIRRVKAAAPGIPVGYVDAYYLFPAHPRLAEACDLLLVNCYPFWEYCALEHAVGYLDEMVARARTAAPGKRVVVTETGWPSAGAPLGAAEPSDRNALLYFLNTMRWAARSGVDVFYFSAFDEEWKASHEGDRGVYWGLWDQRGKLKHGA